MQQTVLNMEISFLVLILFKVSLNQLESEYSRLLESIKGIDDELKSSDADSAAFRIVFKISHATTFLLDFKILFDHI
jgi:uncharacterized protein (UPF0335 family)